MVTLKKKTVRQEISVSRVHTFLLVTCTTSILKRMYMCALEQVISLES